MHRDINRPAELAQIAASLTAAGGRSAAIRVQHVAPAAPGAPADAHMLPAHPTAETPGGDASTPVEVPDTTADATGEDIATEQIRFSVFNCKFLVDTFPSPTRSLTEIGFHSERVRGTEEGRVFTGSLPPNPGFLYEFADNIEVLLSFGKSLIVDFRGSLFLTYLTRELAAAAYERAMAPILFLQTPVAPPPTDPAGDGSRDARRTALSNSIRFSIAISRGRDTARLDFLREVEQIVLKCGVSMHVTDTRGGTRGDWFEVRPWNEEAFRRFTIDRFGSVSEDPVGRVVAMTVVGPARPGSTLAVLSELLSEGIGVVASSISSLSEIAAINLLLPVGPSITDDFAATSGGYEKNARQGLRSLRNLCHLAETPDLNSDLRRLAGYRVLRTEVFDVETAGFQMKHLTTFPVWVAWDLPRGFGDADYVCSRLAKLADSEVAEVEVAYSRTRLMPNGSHRGRAKMNVQIKPEVRLDSLSVSLRALAEYLEDSLRLSLHEDGMDSRIGTIRVTSRERWIGRLRLPS